MISAQQSKVMIIHFFINTNKRWQNNASEAKQKKSKLACHSQEKFGKWYDILFSRIELNYSQMTDYDVNVD